MFNKNKKKNWRFNQWNLRTKTGFIRRKRCDELDANIFQIKYPNGIIEQTPTFIRESFICDGNIDIMCITLTYARDKKKNVASFYGNKFDAYKLHITGDVEYIALSFFNKETNEKNL